jgi:hypothetical protein
LLSKRCDIAASEGYSTLVLARMSVERPAAPLVGNRLEVEPVGS